MYLGGSVTECCVWPPPAPTPLPTHTHTLPRLYKCVEVWLTAGALWVWFDRKAVCYCCCALKKNQKKKHQTSRVTTAWGQNIRWKSFVFLFFGREVGEVHMCVCVWMCALVCFRATLPLQVEKNRYFSLGFFRNPDFRQSIFTLLNSNAAWKEFSSASETLHVFDALPSYQTVHSGKLVNCQMMHSGALLRCQKMYSGVLSCCQVIFSGVELSCWMMRSGNIISWQMMLSGLPLFCGGDVFRFPRAAWLHIQEQST